METKSNNWTNFQRRQEEVMKRSTMTNFAKRTIMEQQNQQMLESIRPVHLVNAKQPQRPQTYDDDSEPIRPTMSGLVTSHTKSPYPAH